MADAPTIYDINIDEWRPVTQEDADGWMRQQQIVGQYLKAQGLLRDAYHLAITGKIEWQAFLEACGALEKLTKPDWPKSRLIDPDFLKGKR